MLKNTLSQKDALILHLKSQVKKVENKIVDIDSFKKQALEVNDGLQSAQDSLCESLEIIQKQYIIINYSLQIIVYKEKELVNTRSKFQELRMWNQSLNVPGIVQFSELEQLKGEMAIKIWKNNLEEIKKLDRESKEACLNNLLVVDVEMDDIDLGDVHSIIGTLNVNEKREDLKKNMETGKFFIQQMNQVNLHILNHFLVKQSLQCQSTQQVAVRIKKNLPLVHRRLLTLN
jgi:hypothetical protein